MGMIENPKTYTGRDLETIFFRPMLTGANAEELGMRVLYNMPVPTTIQLWSPKSDILQQYEPGWSGGKSSDRKQKTINLTKIKAELGYSAADYLNQVYELIISRSDVNLGDLTGTELEQAETEMFRAAIAESLRTMMWIGDTEGTSHTLFDGILKLVHTYNVPTAECTGITIDADSVVNIFNQMWEKAAPRLKSLKGDGNLALFVTSDIYDAYEQWLDNHHSDAAYTDITSGRRELAYHGIKVIDMNISPLLPTNFSEQTSYAILTDRRNFVMAVNTADYPGSEVRMWYNPDEMENRQRATFLAGCEILDEELVVSASFV